MVRMRHAGVEQEIEVAEISVPQYERSGWQVVDGQPGRTIAAAQGRRRSSEEKN
ncbi:hypothetical protein ACFVWY_08870 [Streptomyces sp. NPDC058195]|uniref:hypothetical protein n=1 Tax=Streptomyces sp. NPDC058195 TaxID=3346375 RepID=UPI0036EF40F0